MDTFDYFSTEIIKYPSIPRLKGDDKLFHSNKLNRYVNTTVIEMYFIYYDRIRSLCAYNTCAYNT